MIKRCCLNVMLQICQQSPTCKVCWGNSCLLIGAPTFLHPVSSFPLKASLIRNRLEKLGVENSAHKHRTKTQKWIWSLPSYAVFALDEGVVNKFYFQPHTLCCFSPWLSLPEQLGTSNTGSLTLVCAWTTAFLSGACSLGFATLFQALSGSAFATKIGELTVRIPFLKR